MKGQHGVENLTIPSFVPPTEGLIQLRKGEGNKKPTRAIPSHPSWQINAGKLSGAAP